MMRRRRPLARAAIVGGAAYAAGRHGERRREQEYEQEERLSSLESQQAYAAPAAEPAPSPDEVFAQLEKLADLKQKGVLSDAEFEVQKQKLLQRT